MEALRKKWNSDRGASILLAMLFLLVCMMVGASVLMAAASNAGKSDSNKTEQQKYLAVSSAMTMLVDELQTVKYVGKYGYEKTAVMKWVPVLDANGMPVQATGDDGEPLVDDDGNPVYKQQEVVDYYIHTYTRGDIEFIGNGKEWLDAVLPLRQHFDYVFNNQFKVPESEKIPGDWYDYKNVISTLPDPGSTYTLTFTGPGGYGGLNEQVTIKVELRADGSILLTGTTKDKDFTMMALLKPVKAAVGEDRPGPEKLLVLSGSPGAKENNPTGTIQWELEYIFKKEEKGAAGG